MTSGSSGGDSERHRIADGQRFLVEMVAADQAPAPITVVLNWRDRDRDTDSKH